MAQTTPDASFGPFYLFVGFLFPLRQPWLAAVGLRGPSWLSSAPKRGCGGCGHWCSRLSCTVHSHRHGGYARVGLLTRVCTGRVTDSGMHGSGMHGSGVLPGLPAPVPVPVTLGVWPDPCLSLA